MQLQLERNKKRNTGMQYWIEPLPNAMSSQMEENKNAERALWFIVFVRVAAVKARPCTILTKLQ